MTAAMAHLNLTLIHPFSDGNGRMARCLQTLVLAAAGELVRRSSSSIEEYLGANTAAYYAVLTEVAASDILVATEQRPALDQVLSDGRTDRQARHCAAAHHRTRGALGCLRADRPSPQAGAPHRGRPRRRGPQLAACAGRCTWPSPRRQQARPSATRSPPVTWRRWYEPVCSVLSERSAAATTHLPKN